MSFSILRPQIKSLLQTLSTLEEVSGEPKLNFSGFPAAAVVPFGNESTYETNAENLRTYQFEVQLFVDTKDIGVTAALEDLEAIVDSVLDLFDQEDLKDSTERTIGLNLGNRYTYINLVAHPAVWGGVPDTEYIMATVRVGIRVSVDIQ